MISCSFCRFSWLLQLLFLVNAACVIISYDEYELGSGDMLFRKISIHLKEQNWFAVVLDLFIVILGIFLGMQASEWNEERKQRIEQYEYIQRLIDDAEQSISEIEEVIQFQQMEYDELIWATSKLHNGEFNQEDKQRLERLLIGLKGWRQAFYYTDTIEELLSSGRLTIFESSQLRSQIARFRVEYDFYNKRADVLGDSFISHQMNLGSYLSYTPTGNNLLNNIDDLIAKPEIYNTLNAIAQTESALMRFTQLLLQKSKEFHGALKKAQ